MYRLSNRIITELQRQRATVLHRTLVACFSSNTNRAPPLSIRRRRTGYTTIPETPVRPNQLGLSEAYRPNEENVDDYLAKASLSPWVPLPDAACRALVDLVQMNETDKHVDLGSGDGRVNFWVADGANVEWTLGVDVDEGILQVARERLSKRHPLPKHIDFVQVDLLKDQEHPVWDRIRQATVISMYFATPALRQFRPMLEEQLRGHSCKIVTAGYPMPGWTAWQTTVVLGITLHYYKWGEQWDEEIDDDELSFYMADDALLPPENNNSKRKALESDRFRGANVIDMSKQRVERFQDDSDLFEDDDDDDKEDENDGKTEKTTIKVQKVKSCQRSK